MLINQFRAAFGLPFHLKLFIMFTLIFIIVMALVLSYIIGMFIKGLMTEGASDDSLNWKNVIANVIIGAIVLIIWSGC